MGIKSLGRVRCGTMIGVAALCLWVAATATAQSQMVINLGTLYGGDQSNAYGLNAQGQVVGRTVGADTVSHAFVWSLATAANGLLDIGPIEARAINDHGLVAGFGFLYDTTNAGTTPLPPIAAGGFASRAYGINNYNLVVGNGYPASGPFHAFAYSAPTGTMTDLSAILGLPAFDVTAYGVNDAGQVVGDSFVWDRVNGGRRVVNTLGGTFVALMAINASGIAVGYADVSPRGLQHAVRYDTNTGQLSDLGTLPGAGAESFAYGINTQGQIVGSSDDIATGTTRATLWNTDGTITDLNSL